LLTGPLSYKGVGSLLVSQLPHIQSGYNQKYSLSTGWTDGHACKEPTEKTIKKNSKRNKDAYTYLGHLLAMGGGEAAISQAGL
jgi:hypothetical protein